MKGRGKSLGRIGAILAQAIMLACLALPTPARAQTVYEYPNDNDGNIDGDTNCPNRWGWGGDPLVREFEVSDSFVIADVDIGVFVTHSYRGYLRMTLTSPDGETRVQIVDDDNDIYGNNFNVELDDEATQRVNTDGDGTNHSANEPPFQHTYIPDEALSAFDGEASDGTWRLEICQEGGGGWWDDDDEDGTFQHAELYLTAQPSADLSLEKTVGASGDDDSVQYTLTVSNASFSSATATGVTVTDDLPWGVSYSSHSGGAYNPATGVWAVGTLAPGESRSLTIVAAVTTRDGRTIDNEAEVSSSSVPDIDSTPGNGASGEDDYASASFVTGRRLAGIPPTLMCPKGTLLFDWDDHNWTTGATSDSYAVTGIGTIAFSVTNPATWMNNYPIRSRTVTGGLSPAQYSLAEGIEFDTDEQIATTTITLPLAVDGLQFRIFDVDYADNDFADWVRVTGTFNGTAVTPVLTNGVSNYTVGNEAFGDALSSDPSSDGNVVVTFQSAVDTIVIEYGNHSLAPAHPDGQAITIHDITFCEPHADIAVSKTSTVIENPIQGSTDPTAIPGATLSYCILVTNGGSARATSVNAVNPIPADVTFVPGSMQSGANCSATATAEDDDDSGGDDTDAIGASFAGNQVLVTTATLDPFQSIALRFRATVN